MTAIQTIMAIAAGLLLVLGMLLVLAIWIIGIIYGTQIVACILYLIFSKLRSMITVRLRFHRMRRRFAV